MRCTTPHDLGAALVTCGGQFDHSTGHYRSNIIVFATLRT